MTESLPKIDDDTKAVRFDPDQGCRERPAPIRIDATDWRPAPDWAFPAREARP